MAVIELVGFSSKNLGDVLMLEAAATELKARVAGLRVAVRRRDAFSRLSLGLAVDCLPLLREARGRRRRLLRETANRFVLEPASRLLGVLPGIAAASDLIALVDVCGYKHGGFWGSSAIESDLRTYAAWKARGRAVVLLPKTFGPFEDRSVGGRVRELIALSDLCFARDLTSHRHLVSLGVSPESCPVYPDYTTTVPGVRTARLEPYAGRPLVIPNIRMTDSGAGGDVPRYLAFLSAVCRAFCEQVAPPVILLHDHGRDLEVCEALATANGLDLAIERQASAVKGLIAEAPLVYSDRFHGIVGALSQGVPAIAAGWSHKYREIMETYGVDELLLSPETERERPAESQADTSMKNKVREVLDHRENLRVRLRAAAERIRAENAEMWERVARVLLRFSGASGGAP